MEDIIKAGILDDLRIGAITTFQVEEKLTLKGLPPFEVKRLKKEILKEHSKKNPC